MILQRSDGSLKFGLLQSMNDPQPVRDNPLPPSPPPLTVPVILSQNFSAGYSMPGKRNSLAENGSLGLCDFFWSMEAPLPCWHLGQTPNCSSATREIREEERGLVWFGLVWWCLSVHGVWDAGDQSWMTMSPISPSPSPSPSPLPLSLSPSSLPSVH